MSNEQTTASRRSAQFRHLIYKELINWRLFGFLILIPLFLSACSGERPTNLGVHQGRLSPCPESPNCISTHSTEDAEHFTQPLMFSGNTQEVFKRIHQALKTLDRAEVITQSENYLHAEFTSLVFRFVDDVEFFFENKTGTLHVRSASRIGHSDLGVNRERVETIFSLLRKTDKKPKA